MWFYSALLIPTSLEALGGFSSFHSQFLSVTLFDRVVFPTLWLLGVTVENLTGLVEDRAPPAPREKQHKIRAGRGEKEEALFPFSFSISFVEMQDRYLI